MTVFGTRPETIKLASVIAELRKREIRQVVCVSGQQREMLDQMLDLFEIQPDYDLNIMKPSQSLEHITASTLTGLGEVLDKETPSIVLVQGDTTTAFAAALAASYRKIPVGHVEAGLRTANKFNPFPEEINRRLLGQLAEISFAPTELSSNNLLREGVDRQSVHITGNTVIDALEWVTGLNLPFKNEALDKVDFKTKRAVLVTTHRRENIGDGMEAIFRAIARLAKQYADLYFIFPVHLNPAIVEHSERLLKDLDNVLLTSPLDYPDLAQVIRKCYMVMTDSGGIQEEAPAFGKPVLVLRSTTERPEGIEAGVAQLAGTDEEAIFQAADELIGSPDHYRAMAQAVNPYGDGHAAERIVTLLEKNYG